MTVALSPSSITANDTSTTTATAAVTDSAMAGVVGDTVAFSSTDAAEKVGTTADNGNGTYTATIISSTTVGPATISATDSTSMPSGSDLSASATLTQTAGLATSVVVALSPTSIVANGTSTTTASATVEDAEGHLLPTETVAFSSSDTGDKVSTTTTAGSGVYTATITSSTSVGVPTITAVDGTVSGTAPLTQTAGPAASVAVALDPQVILANGTSITVTTATVKDAQGHLLPGQTVSFESTDPGQFFGQQSQDGIGAYSVQIRSSTTVGQSTITATDTSGSPSVSGQARLTQAAGPSSTALVASPSALVTNETVTLFATVNPGTGSPSGAITFNDGGMPIANCVGEPITPSQPAATCLTSFSASTSPEELAAVFIPDSASTAPGSTAATTVTVTPDSASVSLAVSTTAVTGQRTTYTAAVTPPASRSGPIEPSGSVDFFDDGQPVASCLGQPLTNGVATCTDTYNSVGTHSITARYGGDTNFTGSTTQAHAISVMPVPVHVRGIIASTMLWTFDYTPASTKVLVLLVNRASADAAVLVKCHGPGCPFARHVSRLTNTKHCGRTSRPKCPTAGSLNLAPAFQKDPLHPGATIIITITRPDWIGKYYKFTILAGSKPRIRISCLAVGRTHPGVGC